MQIVSFEQTKTNPNFEEKKRELSWVFLQGQSKSYKNFIEQNFPHIMPPKILVLSDEFSSVLYFLQ